MTDTITAAHFEAALDERPDAWDVRLQYADWLDEQGRPYEAMAQRWMVKHKTHLHLTVGAGGYYWGLKPCEYWTTETETVRRYYAQFVRFSHAAEYPIEAGLTALAKTLRYLHTEVLGLPSLEG